MFKRVQVNVKKEVKHLNGFFYFLNEIKPFSRCQRVAGR